MKCPILYDIANWVFQIPNWLYLIQLEISDWFFDSALPDSYIPNPQLNIYITPIWEFEIPNWGKYAQMGILYVSSLTTCTYVVIFDIFNPLNPSY